MVQFGKHTVTKAGAPELMRLEVEKTRRAFEIGLGCGLFRVPEVLDFDESKGIAVFERIRGIEPLICGATRSMPVVEQVGRSLAIIHAALTLPREMTFHLPCEFAMPGTEVFLHGDFNGCNVCLETSSQSLVILDWQMTSRHGGQATYGTRYFDLLWFVNFMLWSPRFHYLVCDPVAPVANRFCKTYLDEAHTSHDTEALMRYAKTFFDSKLSLRKRHANWRTRCLLWRSQMLTDRFVESLGAMGT